MRYVDKGDYVVATPDDMSDPTPLTCPTCELIMSSRGDVASYAQFGCCAWCERMWVQGGLARARWASGWRPDRSAVRDVLRGMGMLCDT